MKCVNKLVERFGMCKNNPVECYDKHNLFIKSGITVVAALAGEGKTTYIQSLSKEWVKDGYAIAHINFDDAPTYGGEMMNPPGSDTEFREFRKILGEEATNKTILVIDSLKAMCTCMGVNVEDNSDMYPVMQSLRKLCKKTGLNIIIIHHVYKAKNVKTMETSFYGSRAVEEQCDSGFIYTNRTARIVKNRAGHARDKIIELEND